LNLLDWDLAGEIIRRFTHAQISKMRALRKQGYSYKEIASFSGCLKVWHIIIQKTFLHAQLAEED